MLQNDSTTEDDDDGDDDDDEEVVTILPEDKYRVGSLEKMISVMALLVEESRCERYAAAFLAKFLDKGLCNLMLGVTANARCKRSGFDKAKCV